MAGRHIALLLRDLPIGGAERAMLRLGAALADAGSRVDLLLVHRKGPLLAEVPESLELRELGRVSTWRALLHLRRILRLPASRLPGLAFEKLPSVLRSLPSLERYLVEAAPDALVTTITTNNLAALWAVDAAGSGTRVVIREAISLSQHLPGWTRGFDARLPELIRAWYPRAHAVVANSEGSARDLMAATGLAERRVSAIPNAVDVVQIQAQAEAACPHPWLDDGGAPVVLGVGRLEPQKGFATLIEAFAQLRRRRPARLIVVGEGRMREELSSRVQELGVAADVALPGADRNPCRWMARARVFVLPSLFEGSPNALLEALACGAKAVATDCPNGPRELLGGGRFGRLVPVEDPGAMAAAIEASLDEAQDPEASIARAREFSPEAAARRYLALIDAP